MNTSKKSPSFPSPKPEDVSTDMEGVSRFRIEDVIQELDALVEVISYEASFHTYELLKESVELIQEKLIRHWYERSPSN